MTPFPWASRQADTFTKAREDLAIEIDGLRLSYASRGSGVTAVADAGFSVRTGETLALVGESGSGKSSIASAVGGLLPDNATIDAGTIRLFGRDVSKLSERQWRGLRGPVLGYVPQDPLGSLDPLMRVGDQIAESVAHARDVGAAEARAHALQLLDHVGILDARNKARAYPHELSGGQLQRVLIASALAGRPEVLIADEPTSALDVTVQKRILDLLFGLQQEFSLTLLLITHDLSLAGERADRIVVLRDGRVVEAGETEQIVRSPQAIYTRQLFADVPALNPDKYARAAETVRGGDGDGDADAAISVSELSKSFRRGVPAVDGVSFTVAAGEIHALVGESGSGKTTIARIASGLTGFDSGSVNVLGDERPRVPAVVNPAPERLQMVYQNPLSALDPRFPVVKLVGEPLAIRGTPRREILQRAGELLSAVGLSRDFWDRRASQLSGGQRQRVAIARALIVSPKVLVLDEPSSALDVTVQSQIVELLHELRELYRLTFLFISHDLSLVRQIADSVTVLDRGRVVESGDARSIFAAPSGEYTRTLIEAIPQPRI
jgi:peptide/nickel transport system ATP-binding protein